MPICPHCHKESAEYYYRSDAESARRATFLNGDYKDREWWQCIYCKENIHTEEPSNKKENMMEDINTKKEKCFDKILTVYDAWNTLGGKADMLMSLADRVIEIIETDYKPEDA